MGKYNAIDLFSGAGGLSYGFESAGFNILLGIDNDNKALLILIFRFSLQESELPLFGVGVSDKKNNQLLNPNMICSVCSTPPELLSRH